MSVYSSVTKQLKRDKQGCGLAFFVIVVYIYALCLHLITSPDSLVLFCTTGAVPIVAAILLIIFGLCHLTTMAATSQSVTVEDSIEVSAALTKFSTSLFQVVNC